MVSVNFSILLLNSLRTQAVYALCRSACSRFFNRNLNRLQVFKFIILYSAISPTGPSLICPSQVSVFSWGGVAMVHKFRVWCFCERSRSFDQYFSCQKWFSWHLVKSLSDFTLERIRLVHLVTKCKQLTMSSPTFTWTETREASNSIMKLFMINAEIKADIRN